MRWLSLVLAGCGRIAFDPLGGSSDDGATPFTCSPQPETCNGIDDDCDGASDEGCPCTPFEIIVPSDSGEANITAAWTGDGYVVGSRRGGAWRITFLGPDGSIGPDVPIAAIETPQLAWDGTHVVAITEQLSVVRVQRIARDGSVALDRTLELMAGQPKLWAVPGGYVVAGQVAGTHVDAILLDRELTTVGSLRMVHGMSGERFDDVALASTMLAATFDVVGGDQVLVRPEGQSVPFFQADPARRIALSGDQDGFVIMTTNTNDVISTAHATPNGTIDVAPVPSALGTFRPNNLVMHAHAGRHIAYAVGVEGIDEVIYRLDVDGRGAVQSTVRVLQRTPTGQTVSGRPRMYLDAQRAAVVWMFGPTTMTSSTLVQTCL